MSTENTPALAWREVGGTSSPTRVAPTGHSSLPAGTEYTAENGIHVAKLSLQRKGLSYITRRKVTANIWIALDEGEEIFAGFPDLHRVALYPAVRILAGGAAAGKIKQKLAGKDQPF